jgi:hypothetical protein
MIDAGEFDIQNFMRTEGIPYLFAKEKARRRARADGAMQTATTAIRLDADDPLSKAARDAAKRLFLQGMRTDEEREKRIDECDREMAYRQWLEQFHTGLVAKQNAERARPDLEAAAQAAERRINELWRPKS